MRNLLLVTAAMWAGPVLAQGQSTFPATLACDAVPSGPGAVRAQGTLTVTGSDARYTLQARGSDGGKGATETGSGVLAAGGRLSLTGSAGGYQGRYAGEIGGRGGRLAGEQTGRIGEKPFRRACQMIVGDR